MPKFASLSWVLVLGENFGRLGWGHRGRLGQVLGTCRRAVGMVLPTSIRGYQSGLTSRAKRVLSRRCARTAARSIERLEPRAMLAASALYPTVTLDPVDRLATSRVLGEWNTDGNFESWT